MSSSYQFNVYDLDLDKLEKVDDPDELPQIFNGLIQADCDFKILPARQWTENFLYYSIFSPRNSWISMAIFRPMVYA